MNRRAYYNLLLARTRELSREPEVVFWVFFFPVLLAVALGIAFRERPPDKVFVAVAEHPAPRDAILLDLVEEGAAGPRHPERGALDGDDLFEVLRAHRANGR